MAELTTSLMHDARDAEDKRLLEAGAYARLVESYYGVIVKRCQARTKSDGDAFDVAADVQQDLMSLLDGLPEREREVAGLRIVAGLEPAVIATKLGISRNNVDQAWHRAKQKLRERLEA